MIVTCRNSSFQTSWTAGEKMWTQRKQQPWKWQLDKVKLHAATVVVVLYRNHAELFDTHLSSKHPVQRGIRAANEEPQAER